MKIIDKAAWHIDAGVPEEFVVKHFQTVFCWLVQKDMLSDEGKEELEDGIDSSASLNEDLVTPKALVFLEKCYDEYLRALEEVGIYGNDSSKAKLEELYFDFLKL